MPDPTQDEFSLYADDGERKYLNQAERQRVLEAMEGLNRTHALFSLLLAWTGARITETLSVTPNSFDIDRNVVVLRTLKRRRHHAREIPIKPTLMMAIDRHFDVRGLQRNPETANRRLWSFGRVTAWRSVKSIMLHVGIVGRRACPRGLRHGFAVSALQATVPLPILQKWMGHSRLSTTAIYTSVCGPEEIYFAARLWGA